MLFLQFSFLQADIYVQFLGRRHGSNVQTQIHIIWQPVTLQWLMETPFCIISYWGSVGSKGALLLWQQRWECISGSDRDYSTGESDAGNETAVFLPPNLRCFLCIPVWLRLSRFLVLVLLLKQVPCVQFSTRGINCPPSGSEHYSLWQSHRLLLALADPNRLRRQISDLQILFGFGHTAMAVWHSSSRYLLVKNQVFLFFFIDNQCFILLCAFKIPSLKFPHVGVWGEEKQLRGVTYYCTDEACH